MAEADATIKSTLFHPEHPLKIYHYGEEGSTSCAACELRVTGTGYRCDGCNFNIHEACLSLPMSISVPRHPGHKLDLYRLTAGGTSRCCEACKETSHAGGHMYICAACNYSVHLRCRSLAASQPPLVQGGGRRRRRALLFTKISLKIGVTGLKVANTLTGGIMTPAIGAIDAAVDRI